MWLHGLCLLTVAKEGSNQCGYITYTLLSPKCVRINVAA